MKFILKTYDHLFSKPTAQQCAKDELDDAQRKLLTHQTASEYHTRMVKFYEANVARLSAYLEPQK